MKHETITIKFREGGGSSPSQQTWYRLLRTFCDALVDSGYAVSTKLNVVFPGESNPAMASMFTIEVEPTRQGLEQPLDKLQRMPEVQFAKLAPSRKPLHNSAAKGSAWIPPRPGRRNLATEA